MGHLTVNICNKSEASHWFSPLNFHGCLKQELPGSTHDSGFASIGRALLPWVGVRTRECIIKNLSLTLGELANSTAKAVAA